MSPGWTKERLERQAWLLYYNHILLARGVIGEEEYRQMAARIRRAPANAEKE